MRLLYIVGAAAGLAWAQEGDLITTEDGFTITAPEEDEAEEEGGFEAPLLFEGSADSEEGDAGFEAAASEEEEDTGFEAAASEEEEDTGFEAAASEEEEDTGFEAAASEEEEAGFSDAGFAAFALVRRGGYCRRWTMHQVRSSPGQCSARCQRARKPTFWYHAKSRSCGCCIGGWYAHRDFNVWRGSAARRVVRRRNTWAERVQKSRTSNLARLYFRNGYCRSWNRHQRGSLLKIAQTCKRFGHTKIWFHPASSTGGCCRKYHVSIQRYNGYNIYNLAGTAAKLTSNLGFTPRKVWRGQFCRSYGHTMYNRSTLQCYRVYANRRICPSRRFWSTNYGRKVCGCCRQHWMNGRNSKVDSFLI